MLFKLKIFTLLLVAANFASHDLVGQQPNQTGGQTQPSSRAISKRYVPQHMRRTSQPNVVPVGYAAPQDPIFEELVDPVYNSAPAADCGCDSGGHIIGGPVEQVIGGPGGEYCGCEEADCRDCQTFRDCWFGRVGGLFQNAEYFAGAQASRSFGFSQTSQAREPGTFGFHSGFNIGLPLYRLTCGLVSGQFGLRSVHSNFETNNFASNERQQLFMTAGFFRRVDYGLQFGAVVDVLREDWIAKIDLVQIRGELSYVWPAGSSFGFRFSEGVQDDNAPGQIGGQMISVIPGATLDTSRFFYRRSCSWGGHAEAFFGWSDESHAIYGAAADIPLGNCTALQTGFTYLSPDDAGVLGDSAEAWNIFMGITYRPRGKGWYKFYHRPLLPVADNGSMIIRRD